ncbi:hypothetical protein BDY19DRAFT_17937 [Irpex rosettiformis]|uniref:Uncharacterized protein n=1 Tax=Irpex rosettiformis TaxID=378272 RepID=A0ACB8UJ70_9APHY|nr:hypothetical protein BDY19DRAFT_17937 [Irpex rosettiformis]
MLVLGMASLFVSHLGYRPSPPFCILTLYFYHHTVSSYCLPTIPLTNSKPFPSAALLVMHSSPYDPPAKFDVLHNDVKEFSCGCGFMSLERQLYMEHVDNCALSGKKSSTTRQGVPSHRSRTSKRLERDSSSKIFLPRNHSKISQSIIDRCKQWSQYELDMGENQQRASIKYAKAHRTPTPPLAPAGSCTSSEVRSDSPAHDAARQPTPEVPELSHSDSSESSGSSNNAIQNMASSSVPSTPLDVPSTPTPASIDIPRRRLFLESPSPVKSEFSKLESPFLDNFGFVLDEELLPPSSREPSPAHCAINEFLSGLGSNLESLAPIFFQLGIMDVHDLNFLSTLSVADLHDLFPLQSVNGLHVNFMQREYIKEGLRTRLHLDPAVLARAPPRTTPVSSENDPRCQSAVWSFLASLRRPMTGHFQVLMDDGVVSAEDLRWLAQNTQLHADLRKLAPCTSQLSALDWLYIQDGLRNFG